MAQGNDAEIKAACQVFRRYKFNPSNKEELEKLRKSFDECNRIIQSSGISEKSIHVLNTMHISLSSNRAEFVQTEWNPPLDTYPIFAYFKSLLISMVSNVRKKYSNQDLERSIQCLTAIFSLFTFFKFDFEYNDKFLNAVKDCLIEVRDNEYSSNDFHYAILIELFQNVYIPERFKSADTLAYQKLYYIATTPILNCILNYYEGELKNFYTVNKGRATGTSIYNKQYIFLHVFPDYILLDDKDIVKPSLTASQCDIFCRALFKFSETVFLHLFQLKITEYTLSDVLTRFLNLMNYCNLSVYFRRCVRQHTLLFDHLLRLLRTPFFVQDITNFCPRFGNAIIGRTVNKKFHDLVVAATKLLYNISVESCVTDRLRLLNEEEKPAVLFVLMMQSKTESQNEISFVCETILGLMEKDIDTLRNPQELASSYIDVMSKAMRKPNHCCGKVRLSDTIIHLKSKLIKLIGNIGVTKY
ncbi:unnamed protein product [Rotaria socialis]|uniref:Uncharacterized protein n=1 Tax=Rotaria socialis TaxID=392032 RepID=A0A821T665_9BILA|nr:unnamed protein product [Rotaria socialis]